jgi:hypothetical protein
MRCHYCDREATFTAETGGVQVGLCDRHFRDEFQRLAQSNQFGHLRHELNLDRP